MSDAFDKLLEEVRTDLGVREAESVDWKAVDAGLFDRIDRERRAERARLAPPRRRGIVLAVAGFAAAAAIIAIIAGKSREGREAEGPAPVPSAGMLTAIDGEGSVLVDGKPALGGAALHLGDVIETEGVEATVERAGKLTLTLAPGSRTVVTHVRGALVLALERGSVEAQVVPVASGEAFAVDVEGSRVAVHGTHLRVARTGDRVVVDLNEGVVAVGEAPRAGSVVGTLVNAPAHVEFESKSVQSTLVQTHDPAAVRPPALQTTASVARPSLTARPDAVPSHAAPAFPGEPHPGSRPLVGSSAKPAIAMPEPSPETTIARAVRACMAARPRADNVTVVVNTTLRLDLNDDGSVRAALFDPPVLPDVNGCASQAIYRERFGHGGPVAIPIDFASAE